jgi:BlaI family transcriptional regulator, penicillinase repressor
MKQAPRISETEWEVMPVVWAYAPCTARQIIAALTHADATWHPKTIKAFLNRLVKKRVLGFRKEGRAYLYRSLVRESECVAAASQSFLDRVFGGALKRMVAHFVERKQLSADELQELKELLEKRERRANSGRQDGGQLLRTRVSRSNNCTQPLLRSATAWPHAGVRRRSE